MTKGLLMLLHKKRGRVLAARKAPLITGHPATLQKEQIRPRSDARFDGTDADASRSHLACDGADKRDFLLSTVRPG
jgi:hypothetical protein